jgi:hypothetical protein
LQELLINHNSICILSFALHPGPQPS